MSPHGIAHRCWHRNVHCEFEIESCHILRVPYGLHHMHWGRSIHVTYPYQCRVVHSEVCNLPPLYLPYSVVIAMPLQSFRYHHILWYVHLPHIFVCWYWFTDCQCIVCFTTAYEYSTSIVSCSVRLVDTSRSTRLSCSDPINYIVFVLPHWL